MLRQRDRYGYHAIDSPCRDQAKRGRRRDKTPFFAVTAVFSHTRGLSTLPRACSAPSRWSNAAAIAAPA
ncbi:MAG: hypothetical protein MI861_06600, partial [Pirellulales bacterium]|nr:hypothetical protein [Pirellulales bacterium]